MERVPDRRSGSGSTDGCRRVRAYRRRHKGRREARPRRPGAVGEGLRPRLSAGHSRQVVRTCWNRSLGGYRADSCCRATKVLVPTRSNPSRASEAASRIRKSVGSVTDMPERRALAPWSRPMTTRPTPHVIVRVLEVLGASSRPSSGRPRTTDPSRIAATTMGIRAAMSASAVHLARVP